MSSEESAQDVSDVRSGDVRTRRAVEISIGEE
ncbi:hypothetical protein A2U01_0105240, partial [Trifolium medium]|nr:hypothetical protein [Trifolium medium]